MAMQRDRYPANWEAISERIRFERAQNRCEQCGVPNRASILRSVEDGARYIIFDEEEFVYRWPDGDTIRMSEIPDEYLLKEKETRVILTVHHIGVERPDGMPGDPRDKMDCRDENLIALCQRCHLLADMDHHVAMAKITRVRKREQAVRQVGQLDFLEEETG